MSDIGRRLSALRRDLHRLRDSIAEDPRHSDPEIVLEEIDNILERDQARIGAGKNAYENRGGNHLAYRSESPAVGSNSDPRQG